MSFYKKIDYLLIVFLGKNRLFTDCLFRRTQSHHSAFSIIQRPCHRDQCHHHYVPSQQPFHLERIMKEKNEITWIIEQYYHQHHVMMMIHDLFSLSVVCLKAKYFICIFSIHWLFCLAGMFFTLGLNGSQVTIFKGMVILFDFLVFEQIFWLLEQIFWVLELYPVVISLSLLTQTYKLSSFSRQVNRVIGRVCLYWGAQNHYNKYIFAFIFSSKYENLLSTKYEKVLSTKYAQKFPGVK